MSSEVRSGSQPAAGRRMKSVCLIGLGNIGSPLASLLARLPDLVDKIILVDGDRYDRSNLTSQEIGSRDVGKPKAIATAERLRQINPELEVIPLAGKVEEIPRTLLRTDLILAALDSLRARTFVNEIATRLSIPWIDAGVEPDGLLARVSVYQPASDGPCMECGLSAAHYEAMDQRLPCATDTGDPRASEAPGTGVPAYLGALAASLAAAECERMLAGWLEGSLAGRELVVSARYHTQFVTNLIRDPHCRFDHSSWKLEKIDAHPSEISIWQVLNGQLLPGVSECSDSGVELNVEPHRFVTRTRCDRCHALGDALFLSGRPSTAPCSVCGGVRLPIHFYTLDRVAATALPDHLLRRSLADVGLQRGDVLTISAGTTERHFELRDRDDG